MTVLLYTPLNEKSGVCSLHVKTVTPEVRNVSQSFSSKWVRDVEM